MHIHPILILFVLIITQAIIKSWQKSSITMLLTINPKAFNVWLHVQQNQNPDHILHNVLLRWWFFAENIKHKYCKMPCSTKMSHFSRFLQKRYIHLYPNSNVTCFSFRPWHCTPTPANQCPYQVSTSYTLLFLRYSPDKLFPAARPSTHPDTMGENNTPSKNVLLTKTKCPQRLDAMQYKKVFEKKTQQRWKEDMKVKQLSANCVFWVSEQKWKKKGTQKLCPANVFRSKLPGTTYLNNNIKCNSF